MCPRISSTFTGDNFHFLKCQIIFSLYSQQRHGVMKIISERVKGNGLSLLYLCPVPDPWIAPYIWKARSVSVQTLSVLFPTVSQETTGVCSTLRIYLRNNGPQSFNQCYKQYYVPFTDEEIHPVQEQYSSNCELTTSLNQCK